MFRLVTTGVFWNGFIPGVSVVSYVDGVVSVDTFEKELHTTVFIPGPIAILDEHSFDEFVADDIELMFSTAVDSFAAVKRLDDYLKSSSLYFNKIRDGEVYPLFLKVGKQCQIIPIN